MAAELATSLTASEADRLEEAESLVRGYCGWHIAPSRTETVEVRSTGTATVFLPSMHVTAIVGVTDDTSELVADEDYTWSEAGVLTRDGRWGVGTVVEVEMTHGYPTVPPEVRSVVRSIAQRAVDNPNVVARQAAGPFSMTAATSDGEVTTGLLESERAVLRRYRIPTVA